MGLGDAIFLIFTHFVDVEIILLTIDYTQIFSVNPPFYFM